MVIFCSWPGIKQGVINADNVFFFLLIAVGGGGGSTRHIFGYRWAADALKPWPCLGQKIPKIHALFRSTPSILLPCLGRKTNVCRLVLSHLLTIAIEQIRVTVIGFVYQNSSGQYSVNRPTQNYIPFSGQRGQKPYIPCPLAHTSTRIGYIRE